MTDQNKCSINNLANCNALIRDERRGDAITAPPGPAVSSYHTINSVESGDNCNASRNTLSSDNNSTYLPCDDHSAECLNSFNQIFGYIESCIVMHPGCKYIFWVTLI